MDCWLEGDVCSEGRSVNIPLFEQADRAERLFIGLPLPTQTYQIKIEECVGKIEEQNVQMFKKNIPDS